MVERGSMAAENVCLLEPLVDAHVGLYGGEVQHSLTADARLVASLAHADDSDLQASLSLLPEPESFVAPDAGYDEFVRMEQNGDRSVLSELPEFKQPLPDQQ